MTSSAKRRVSGPWSEDEIGTFLETTSVPMRLAVNGAAGFPILMPLWFMWADNSFWAAMKPTAGLVQGLRRDGGCAFDVSIETPPYKGVRGRGTAEVIDDGLPVLKQLLQRYLGEGSARFQTWLLERSADECAIRITPETLTAWDFGARMKS